MREKLKFSEYVYVASMLFGLFFGAGNLIFPAHLGQLSGFNMWKAAAGFIVTGVGLPLLGIISMGISKSDGILDMANKVSINYGKMFTVFLYLTVGPFFSIPRAATVPFSVGIEPLLKSNQLINIYLAVFSFVFFLIVLFFSWKPSGILIWIGKILNPLFLLFLGVLVISALINPLGNISDATPVGAYVDKSFFTGFLEGYNTMDALASLAFGIVIINVIKDAGIDKSENIAKNMIKSGFLSMTLMAFIYIAIIMVGAQSRGTFDISDNGGIVLSKVAKHYFGNVGQLLLALMTTIACLKTSIGLITSLSEAFESISNGKFKYKFCALAFTMLSFFIANLGLNNIIAYSIPVLMVLYPLVITLILLNIFGKFFNYSPYVFRSVTLFTLAASLFDFLNALPEYIKLTLNIDPILSLAFNYIPLFNIGLGWLIPAACGFVLGYCFERKSLNASN